MRCLYSSDLHGNPALYEKLFERFDEAEGDALLLGGDLSPLEPPLDRMIASQRSFWEERFAPEVRRRTSAGKRVILIPGNDDLRIHDALLREGHEAGWWELADGAVVELGEHQLVGCSQISPSPFILKDRERFDLEVDAGLTEGAMDPLHPDAILSAERSDADRRRTLRDVLTELFAALPSDASTILMSHCPPHDTAIDILFDGRKIGSRAVREAIERHRPVLSLHGHIHESPDMPGGNWRDAIGATPVVNGGSDHHAGPAAALRVVSFDTADIAGTLGYTRG